MLFSCHEIDIDDGMKTHNVVCWSVLLARSIQVLWGLTGNISKNRRCGQPSAQFWRSVFIAQCSTHALGGTSAFRKRGKSAMSGQFSDYAQHGVRTLKNLGSGDHTMDVIVAGKRQTAQEHVIFFGGDVQDYPENMEGHRDNGRYIRWNSLATAGLLCDRFPTAMVLVIKPHHMHLKTFSVYSQFVKSNDFGAPTHTPDYGAWDRLVKVYEEAVGLALAGDTAVADCNQNGCAGSTVEAQTQAGSENTLSPSGQNIGEQNQAPSMPTEVVTEEVSQSAKGENDGKPASPLPEVSIRLVAFSRGCVVLNQLLQELKAVENNQVVQRFISRLGNITWLDGGHSGGSNTWITDPAALKRLAALGLEIQVHTTPYQMKDEMRPWIAKEKKRFVELLQKAGANVQDTLHFDGEPKTIENHFRVLEVF